jgi:4-amino-4-deoxy-L-arabinose transferase-like glycosyltransferase
MLLAPLPSAPGPLYPVLHALIFPFTKFQAPYVRWLNVSLLFISIVALSICLKSYKFTKPFYRSVAILSVPMVWVTTGMALTEVPAFTMATLSLLAAIFATSNEKPRQFCYINFIVSGLFAGLAILGRQTYFPLIFIFLFLAWFNRTWRLPAISGFSIAFLIPLPVFILWGGLVPKSQSIVAGGINLTHGLLAIAYLGIVVAILAPSFFLILLTHWKWLVGATFLIILTNITILKFEFKVLLSLAKYFPFSEDYYLLIMGSILIIASVVFTLATFFNLFHKYDDKLFLTMTALTILGASTAFGITHLFSSRYIMNCFPFILLMIQPFYSPSVWAILRFSLGGFIGAVILASYYRWL